MMGALQVVHVCTSCRDLKNNMIMSKLNVLGQGETSQKEKIADIQKSYQWLEGPDLKDNPEALIKIAEKQ